MHSSLVLALSCSAFLAGCRHERTPAPGTAPSIEARAEGAEPLRAEVDQGTLAASVRARKASLTACYEEALRETPTLRGRILVRFDIVQTGGIEDLAVVEDGIGSQEVASCLAKAIQAWRLPFRPTEPVTVEYPFFFSPAEAAGAAATPR